VFLATGETSHPMAKEM